MYKAACPGCGADVAFKSAASVLSVCQYCFTTVLRTEFGYTPRYTTEAALIDYARTVPPVVSPRLVDAVTSRLRSAVERVGDTADAVGAKLRPAPPAPGLRAVRDA